ncbi:MAG: monovalent cation/H(+) antiporter subunit G [Clostridia bacterium]
MIRIIVASILMVLGLEVLLTAVIGNFRFAFVLNRMQASATADTLATLLVIGSLIVLSGFSWITVKLIMVIAFLWFANPVASHFLAKTEIIVNKDILDECEVVEYDNI